MTGFESFTQPHGSLPDDPGSFTLFQAEAIHRAVVVGIKLQRGKLGESCFQSLIGKVGYKSINMLKNRPTVFQFPSIALS